MARYSIDGAILDDIADSINAKTGESAAMVPGNMAGKIRGIPTDAMTLLGHIENGATTPAFTVIVSTCSAALLGKIAIVAVADGNTSSGTYVVFSASIRDRSVVFWRGTDESKIAVTSLSDGWTITGATSLDVYRASIVLPSNE